MINICCIARATWHRCQLHILVIAFAVCGSAWADEATKPLSSGNDASFSGINIQRLTLGGQQFWADEVVFREWRIQRNIFTSHYRLLNQNDVRIAWGDRQACCEKLAAEKERLELAPTKGKLVVLVHGLVRSRKFMQPIARHICDNSEYEVISIGYPSTRAGIDSHASDLASVISHLDKEVTEINFVAHSLGCLVVRHYLADITKDGNELDPRVKRFVMLGPPNQGAALARMFKNSRLFHWAVQGAGRQLSTDFDALRKHLGTPPCEFGIIAGSRGNAHGFNPLLSGDDDILIRVEETKLSGARDFRRLSLRHTSLARQPEPLTMTLKFLECGCFESDELRQPIR